MSSALPGASISASEVTDITPFGFWLLVDDSEYFVPFTDYPDFRRATVAQVYSVRRIGPVQLHWPALDIDIELDALARPSDYPLAFTR